MISEKHNQLEKQNAICWEQNKDTVTIQILKIGFNGDKDQLMYLLTELKSKNVMFSIKISKNESFLLIYLFTNPENHNSDTNLIEYLKNSYSLEEAVNTHDFFIQDVKKVSQKDHILQFYHKDGTQSFVLALLLLEIESTVHNFAKRFTNFVLDLLKADIFSIVISSLPSLKGTSAQYTKWSMMLYTHSSDITEIEKREQTFHRFLNANQSKINCKLSYISKNDYIRHKINFRYLVPWRYLKGDFTENIEIIKLFKLENIYPSISSNFDLEPAIPYELPYKTVENEPSEITPNTKRPYPSIKNLKPKHEIINPINEVTKPITHQKNSAMKTENYMLSNLDDMSIPTPKTMNVVFDTEYLKVRISKMFKDFEFKETVIFEDKFDQVLRKGTFYIFIKFYKNILNQAEAYEVIEHLSSIAGLRNQFLCIVVADTIEENSMKILNEFNVLHLTLNDVLLEDSLKSKIYNTILA